MATKQKRKRNPNRKSLDDLRFETVKKSRNIFYEVLREADYPGIYEKQLHLADESRIRQLEGQWDATVKWTLQAYLLKSVPALVVTSKCREKCQLNLLMERDPEYARDILSAAISELITDLLWGKKELYPENPFQIQEICDFIVEKMPSDMYDKQLKMRQEKKMNALHANPLTSSIYGILNWRQVLFGKEFVQWARSAMRFIRHLCDEEKLVQWNTRRDELIVLLSSEAASAAHRLLKHAAESMREEGYDCSYGLPVRQSCVIENSGQMEFHPPQGDWTGNSSVLLRGTSNRGKLKIPEQKLSPRRTRLLESLAECPTEKVEYHDWAICHMAARGLVSFSEMLNLSKSLFDAFSGSELIYSFLTLAEEYEHDADLPLIVQSLLRFVYLQSYPGEYGNTRVVQENADEKLFLSSLYPYPLTSSMTECIAEEKRKCGERESIIEAFSYPVISLRQLIYSHTGVIAPSTLRISLKWRAMLEDIGLRHDDALVLCGFIEGCNLLIQHLQSSAREEDKEAELRKDFNPVRVKEIAMAYAKCVEENEKQQIRQDIRRELESSFAEARNLEERVTAENRRLQRQHRTSLYRATAAEAQIIAKDDTIRCLEEQVKALTEERESLQRTIMDLSQQISAVPPEECGDKEEEKQLNLHEGFPSDIGKDAKIIVYGGSQNWIAEQQKRFPHIRFFAADVLPNDAAIAHADILMVNTFYLSHKYFWTIQGAAKRANKKMDFFQSRGVNSGSQRIIEVYHSFYLSREGAIMQHAGINLGED